MNVRELVLLDGVRTPMGEFGGSLASLTANELGAAAAKALLEKTGTEGAAIDHTVVGNALQTSGDAIYGARHVALKAGVPKEVPALLKNEKTDPYVRANLAVGFARGLTNGRVYEESLAALAGIKVEQTVDPGAYYFYRAVAEHALMKKDDAMRSIVRLLDDVGNAPDRYTMLGRILFVEMATWKKDEKDLANIKRLMDNSERRLGQARAGKITQDIQKKIVFRLDELIKEKENQAKGGA